MDATTLAVRNLLLPDLQTLASSSSTRFGARRVEEEDARVRRSGTRGQAEGLEVRAPIRLAVLAGSLVACHVAISRRTGCLCQTFLSCFIVMCPSYYPCGYKSYPCGYKNYPCGYKNYPCGVEISAADENYFAPLIVLRNCSWRTCKISSQLLFVWSVKTVFDDHVWWSTCGSFSTH